MNRDQLRDLIASATSSGDDVDAANRVLDARLPWLCPDCDVDGIRADMTDQWAMCEHRYAPTLADTVALWEAVHGDSVLRSLAVETVDYVHGYTYEFSGQPGVHRLEYDTTEALLERTLRAVRA